MDLYGFGFNGHTLFLDPSEDGDAPSSGPLLTPKRIIHGRSIDIVWASWCDALIVYSSASALIAKEQPTVLYTGIGISAEQLTTIKNAISGDKNIKVFGSDLSDGIIGMIDTSSLGAGRPEPTRVTFFASEYEVKTMPGILPIQTIGQNGPYRVQHVAITSGGAVNVAADIVKGSGYANHDEQDGGQGVSKGSIFQFDPLAQMKMWLEGRQLPPPKASPMAQPTQAWKQLVSNSISSTALTEEGKVYTWAMDKRYPRCLGRDLEEQEVQIPSEVPFLSETNVKKIAAGGYMTAAVSADGELFLWGQACPGTQGELDILRNGAAGENDDQDEFVKCVELHIQGMPATILDVAVGCGHVLVAAQIEREGEGVGRVFAAGQCGYGQLGIGRAETFVPSFVEVPGFTGNKIVSMAAAGWSSWVVVENDEG